MVKSIWAKVHFLKKWKMVSGTTPTLGCPLMGPRRGLRWSLRRDP